MRIAERNRIIEEAGLSFHGSFKPWASQKGKRPSWHIKDGEKVIQFDTLSEVLEYAQQKKASLWAVSEEAAKDIMKAGGYE